ncbi:MULTISPECIES: hypothetical protein [Pseudomonas]|uniref:Uncharacterized protein n=2 Tax=Pseudomonas entomophila TaxID=312306 RepID=Q1I391_PSEE4|nr:MULTISPECIES: hypothetical protein [Pseudomonas]WMW06412.1 hypothetical protein RAH46_03510 [Pseudomonas entomophila]CAK17895.1 hypothetical protein PSEEN5271 [Pseudomonas entomophila L48]
MLDISYLSDAQGEKPSFIIHDREFTLFESAFWALKQKTGVYIDPYGKARIYPDHQRILVAFLRGISDEKVVSFVSFLGVSIEEDEVLIAYGD